MVVHGLCLCNPVKVPIQCLDPLPMKRQKAWITSSMLVTPVESLVQMTSGADTTQRTGLGAEERGAVKDRPVDSSEGSVGSSSPRCSPIADSVSKIGELIETVETVEIVDGVRARLAAGPSVIETETVSDSIVGGCEGVAAYVVGVAPLVGWRGA